MSNNHAVILEKHYFNATSKLHLKHFAFLVHYSFVSVILNIAEKETLFNLFL